MVLLMGGNNMRQWYVKMVLAGKEMVIPVVAKDEVNAEGEAVKWCIRNGYSAGQFLSVRQGSKS